jgi:hypothetical protein
MLMLLPMLILILLLMRMLTLLLTVPKSRRAPRLVKFNICICSSSCSLGSSVFISQIFLYMLSLTSQNSLDTVALTSYNSNALQGALNISKTFISSTSGVVYFCLHLVMEYWWLLDHSPDVTPSQYILRCHSSGPRNHAQSYPHLVPQHRQDATAFCLDRGRSGR